MEKMSSEKTSILAHDGTELVISQWELENPVGSFCIVPGFGEHAGRYLRMARILNAANWNVYALDNRGHGESGGKRGHTPTYEMLLSDVEELLKSVRAAFTDLPIVLFGHSMGGNIVGNYMLRMNSNEISAFILSAPWFRMKVPPPAWQVKMGKFLLKIAPSLQQTQPVRTHVLTKVKEEQEAYANDPLVHGKITAKLFFGVVEAGEWAIEHTAKLKKQGLVYHGTDDPLIDFDASKEFAARASEKSVDWWAVEGALHEPHNDEEMDSVHEKIIDYLRKI
ncbi:MAG: alpha/beta hydrolase [Cytophagales bacterium]|nr:alpha/beta hydrolase [Cytophagales bacterium]